jgi:hypothetical protein
MGADMRYAGVAMSSENRVEFVKVRRTMRWLGFLFALATLCESAWGQGTINFNNRSLTDPTTGTIYNAPFIYYGGLAAAQLMLVTGNDFTLTYTPIPGTTTFRAAPL